MTEDMSSQYVPEPASITLIVAPTALRGSLQGLFTVRPIDNAHGVGFNVAETRHHDTSNLATNRSSSQPDISRVSEHDGRDV